MRKLFIVGHPSLYGGSGTELHHQILIWSQMPELEIHIIPTDRGYENEPLYQEMLKLNIKYEPPFNFDCVTPDDAVINFCSDIFLMGLEKIYKQTKRIMWVNCMTWTFKLEKQKAKDNYISHYLYQRPQILQKHQQELEALGCKAKFMNFTPYFDSSSLDFVINDQPRTNIGRISRADADKYSENIVSIYDGIVSPKMKRGHFLGFGPRVEAKIKNIPKWIKTYTNQNELPVKTFYEVVDFIVQPTDTTENWPRIGFEAMFSGKPLVVDNKGGWQFMIEHGVTGFLCNHPRDFIYYGSRLAYEFDLRMKIAENAKKKAEELSGFHQSKESWEKVFESVFN